MIEYQYIITPLIGGVIGYITNDIAIRMLFRPHTAKYLFGIHIPFTPGIIPKEKGRIAEAIGQVVSNNLMNKEVLEKYLLSDEMVRKVRSAVECFIADQRMNEETVKQFLGHYLNEEEIISVANSVNENLTLQVHAKLADSSVGDNIAHVVVEHVEIKLDGEGASELFANIGGAFGGIGGAAASLLSGNIIRKFLAMLREPTEKFLSGNINGLLRKNGKEIVAKMIGNEVDSFLDKKVCDLLKGHDEQLEHIVNTIESFYNIIVQEHLPRILDSIDISKIVRERINEMDVNETEALIFQVMDKELKAIVWLGALLGLIMGSINLLF